MLRLDEMCFLNPLTVLGEGTDASRGQLFPIDSEQFEGFSPR